MARIRPVTLNRSRLSRGYYSGAGRFDGTPQPVLDIGRGQSQDDRQFSKNSGADRTTGEAYWVLLYRCKASGASKPSVAGGEGLCRGRRRDRRDPKLSAFGDTESFAIRRQNYDLTGGLSSLGARWTREKKTERSQQLFRTWEAAAETYVQDCAALQHAADPDDYSNSRTFEEFTPASHDLAASEEVNI